MTFEDYLLHLFYLVDALLEALKSDLGRPRLRSRGPEPSLHDSEVITMELAGEFAGIDTDKGIYCFFRRYHRGEFPALARTCRTSFARQAANLWRVKQLLHERLLALLPLADPVEGTPLWLLDSFPLRLCRLARAPGAKLFKDVAGFGHDPTSPRDLYWGLRVHVRCGDFGAAAQLQLTAAAVADVNAAVALAPPPGGWGPALGDRAYWHVDPLRRERWARAGLVLSAPFKKERLDPHPRRSAVIARLRQVVEVVIGQLATRFNAERTRARDLWHLCSRLARKALSHTAAVLLNWRLGNPPLQLDRLVVL